jgi:UDP-glucuronate 4-epimerase
MKIQDTGSTKISVTGAAGFIGANLIQKLVNQGFTVGSALDSFKPSYGGNWCNLRQEFLIPNNKIEVCNLVEEDAKSLAKKFDNSEIVIHLAAFPGIRQGEIKSYEYLVNNVLSTGLLLEACKINKNIKAILFASSSSVYGDLGQFDSTKEEDADGSQLKSNYAMTKWINEIQFKTFQSTLNIPVFGLRFFTVYGEWGRPDMAYSMFTNKILKGEAINIYGKDGGRRTMTHVDDATTQIIELIKYLKSSNYNSSLGFELFNIGSANSITALEMAELISKIVNKKAIYNFESRPVGDSIATNADLTKINKYIGTFKTRNISEGLESYAEWHHNNIDLF